MGEPTHATGEGTRRYRARFAEKFAEGHFREALGLSFSSIGIGTYLGAADPATDRRYVDAVAGAILRGANVIDTAGNYRFQRSERAVGEALRRLFGDGRARRDEVIVATKGGYLAYDGAFPADPSRYFHDTFVDPGVATFDDLVAGCHCVTPRFLRLQIETSLRNLGLSCVDVYFLHNPEQQLDEVPRRSFAKRIRAAFASLEEAASEGKLRWYGVATWDGLRAPADAGEHLELEELVGIARDVGGEKHRFRFVQLPLNLEMREAASAKTQTVAGTPRTPLEAARRLGLAVFASASIAQGKLSRALPAGASEAVPGLRTTAQRALQFVRSSPGVTTALVGMSRPSHVDENLKVAAVPPLSGQTSRELLAQIG